MKKKTCKTCKCEKKEIISDLEEQNKKLQDEVDSLWGMMDEMAAADIKNFSSILEDLQKEILVRSLIMKEKKVQA